MYKLLLITNDNEVKNAFLEIDNWQEHHIRPIIIIEDIDEGISYLKTKTVDAIGYALDAASTTKLQSYLQERESLPVFQSHRKRHCIIEEIQRVRRFLDALHADYADENVSEEVVLQTLRDELVNQLISGEIKTKAELQSRIKLLRANASLVLPCYLYEFDMPQGEVYLRAKWRYGSDRLRNAIRNNFLGKHVDGIYYDVAVLNPRHIRIFACPQMNLDTPEETVQELVQKRVEGVIDNIKNFLDLDLNLEQATRLANMYQLTMEGQEEE